MRRSRFTSLAATHWQAASTRTGSDLAWGEGSDGGAARLAVILRGIRGAARHGVGHSWSPEARQHYQPATGPPRRQFPNFPPRHRGTRPRALARDHRRAARRRSRSARSDGFGDTGVAALLARMGIARSEDGQHDQIPGACRHRRNLDRQFETENIGAEHAFPAQLAKELGRQAGRLQPWHHQNIGRTRDSAANG